MGRLTLLRSLILVTAPCVASAQHLTICADSFDYPVGPLGGQDGGVGWSQGWDAGASMTDGMVISPGADSVGNQIMIDPTNGLAECFRRPDTAPWGLILDNGRFGADGSTLWISFYARRSPGALSEYGGLSLYDGQVENIFLGSPWTSGVWGIQDHVAGGIQDVPGASDDVLTHIVVRIDYLPGPEHLQMWLDPADPHPDWAADLSTPIGDHRWDRLRLGSGLATPNGFEFDDIRVEVGVVPLGDTYCSPAQTNSTGQPAIIMATGSPKVADNVFVLIADQVPPGQFGYFLISQTQGFTTPPGSSGNLCLSNNIGRFSQAHNVGQGPAFGIQVDLNSVPQPGGPVAIHAGETWNFQAWYRDVPSTSNFTDAVSVTFE